MKYNLKIREEIPELLNQLGLNKCGVELGTQTGKFSEVILNNSNLATLWSIDCWQHQDDPEYKDIANHGNLRQKYYHLKTILRLKKFGNRSVILKAFSEEIPKKYDFLKDLDFVYIDANHTYKACKKDLEIWYPRVVTGGVLSGHDYFNNDIPTCKNCGVRRAVDEFMKKHNEIIHTTKDDFPKSWFVIKKSNGKQGSDNLLEKQKSSSMFKGNTGAIKK